MTFCPVLFTERKGFITSIHCNSELTFQTSCSVRDSSASPTPSSTQLTFLLLPLPYPLLPGPDRASTIPIQIQFGSYQNAAAPSQVCPLVPPSQITPCNLRSPPQELLRIMAEAAQATQPDIDSLVTSLAERRTSVDSTLEEGGPQQAGEEAAWSVQSPSHSPRSQFGRSPSSMTQVHMPPDGKQVGGTCVRIRGPGKGGGLAPSYGSRSMEHLCSRRCGSCWLFKIQAFKTKCPPNLAHTEMQILLISGCPRQSEPIATKV